VPADLKTLYSLHPRDYRNNRFVYPVLSRRSRGISIGVNLNPDKVCNFDCIYCQVNRTTQSETTFVETDSLLAELEGMLGQATGGGLYEDEAFRAVPPEMRRLNDIAFSGDGEPTTYRNFDEIVSAVSTVKRAHGLGAVKLVLITNASMFHRPAVERGLAILDANQGEVWAKLEAGTNEYYHLIERTQIPFRRILENITAAAQVRPIVIQALFMRVHGTPPAETEIAAWCDRLNEIVSSGGQISRVQVYTVARPPAESFVSPLTSAELEQIAAKARSLGLPAVAFGD
jgi:wyosine [tRNA(Phe)-imidazoG37] synthetase (radical SAM superfamily)